MAPAVQRVPGEPEPPAWLDQRALGIWAHLAAVLRERGQLTMDNKWALSGLVYAILDWQYLQSDIARNGQTYKVGEIVRIRPITRLFRDADNQLRQWLGEFGLTDVKFQAI